MNELSHISNIILISKANGIFWPIIIVCSAIFALLIWLLLRKLRLWYWKINAQVDTLEKIDLKLREIQRELKRRDETVADQKRIEPCIPTENDEPVINESAPDESVPDESELKAAGEHCCAGKSRKIYTEAMLEDLIRE